MQVILKTILYIGRNVVTVQKCVYMSSYQVNRKFATSIMSHVCTFQLIHYTVRHEPNQCTPILLLLQVVGTVLQAVRSFSSFLM